MVVSNGLIIHVIIIIINNKYNCKNKSINPPALERFLPAGKCSPQKFKGNPDRLNQAIKSPDGPIL